LTGEAEFGFLRFLGKPKLADLDTTVAIGALTNDSNGENVGCRVIFFLMELPGRNWVTDFKRERPYIMVGHTISLSSDGTFCCCGCLQPAFNRRCL